MSDEIGAKPNRGRAVCPLLRAPRPHEVRQLWFRCSMGGADQVRQHCADLETSTATPDAPKLLLSNDFADLHDGRDVRIVGDVRGDLRAVRT